VPTLGAGRAGPVETYHASPRAHVGELGRLSGDGSAGWNRISDRRRNDPNDVGSVAIAALGSPAVLDVRPEDHAQLMKL